MASKEEKETEQILVAINGHIYSKYESDDNLAARASYVLVCGHLSPHFWCVICETPRLCLADRTEYPVFPSNGFSGWAAYNGYAQR